MLVTNEDRCDAVREHGTELRSRQHHQICEEGAEVATLVPMTLHHTPFDGQLRLALTRRRVIEAHRLGPLASTDVVQWLTTADSAWDEWGPRLAAIGFPVWAGAMTIGEQRALVALVRAIRPARVLEVGTFIGASTVALAAGLASLGGNRRLITIDRLDVNAGQRPPWAPPLALPSPRELLRHLQILDGVTFVKSASLEYLRTPSDDFDLILLDGDHAAHVVYREIAAAIARLRKGGYLILHDYFPDGAPMNAAQEFMTGPWRAVRRCERESTRLAVASCSPLPWPSVGDIRATSLAVLGTSRHPSTSSIK